MKRVLFVPGVVVSPAAITLPADAPDIDAVVSAEIERVAQAVIVPNHAPADVATALADHAVHAHDFKSQGLGGAVANNLGLPAGLNAINDSGAAAVHTVPGGGATGVQSNAAAQTHSGSVTPVTHGFNTGATPVVATVPTKITARTFSLSVNTLAGDLLSLVYQEVGVISRP